MVFFFTAWLISFSIILSSFMFQSVSVKLIYTPFIGCIMEYTKKYKILFLSFSPLQIINVHYFTNYNEET